MSIERGKQIHSKTLGFYIGDIGTQDIILGTDWLIKHNPSINWSEYLLRMDQCPRQCKTEPIMIIRSKHQSCKNKPVKKRIVIINEHSKDLWTEEEESEEKYSEQGALMAQSLFHGKSKSEFYGSNNQVIKKKTFDIKDPLSWSKVRWKYFVR
jgi:hypothetical protein